MYDYIKGAITSLTHTSAVIEAGGVGYFMSISLTTHSAIESLSQTTLYTHTYIVQDQAPVLFGFASIAERALFRLLISVSGIGGGTARIMLSSHSPAELASIIASGNVALLTKVKGIGPKTAEVVIVKLRDKVVGLPLDGGAEGVAAMDGVARWMEALEALLVLGFSKVATEKIVRKVAAESPDASTEEIIRKTLSLL